MRLLIYAGLPAVLLLAVAGCSKELSDTLKYSMPQEGSPPPSASDRQPLKPAFAWPPKEQSPEFKRAARLMEAMPMQLALPGLDRTLVGSWEFVGSLSDAQLKELLAKKQLKFRPSALTLPQRAAIWRWLNARGLKDSQGLRQLLLENGTKRDLSKDEGSLILDRNLINLDLQISRSDGRSGITCGATLGQVRPGVTSWPIKVAPK